MAKKKKPEIKSKRISKRLLVPRERRAGGADLAIDSMQGDGEARHLPPFPIVVVGASAGGLEAVSQILDNLPSNPGMAIIIAQHLSPNAPSLLTELLAGHSRIPVEQVTDAAKIQADHVYVIPPNRQMAMQDGHLRLQPRPEDRSQYMPIDHFFGSVAEHAQSRAIGVVLSGSASDGANGICAIKAAGGITIAQTPETAQHDSMPRAAIATGMVDLVLSPQEIAQELVRIVLHPYLQLDGAAAEPKDSVPDEQQLRRIFQLLRNTSGVDFTHYKLPTVRRRLQRRMVLQKIAEIDRYVKYLETNPSEVDNLYQDILIHVTQFFREPESFEVLKKFVFPQFMKGRRSDAPVRIWVPGCSTGEEPYSIAIALLEYLEADSGKGHGEVPIQIFATDVSETAIEQARAGFYRESVTQDVGAERLRRFFSRSDGSYRISKAVRDLCIFARQDLTRDPPFSRLDLIVCRNVLIYLGAPLQQKLMSIFHYALKPHGFLVLGHNETVGIHGDLFEVAEKKHRVYARKFVMTPPLHIAPDYHPVPLGPLKIRHAGERPGHSTIQNQAHRVLFDRFTPPAVIVDKDLQIVQFFGHTGPFLEPAPGDASLNVLKMVREGLLGPLRSALRSARDATGPVRREGVRVKHNGHVQEVDLEVIPLEPVGEEPYFLILFLTATAAGKAKPAKQKAVVNKTERKKDDHEQQLATLEQELIASREYLQSIIQDLEAANEELQSANEEILSSNEELQSTNEELDTAKEELQSTNEELNTLNDELHSRNEEVSRANSDLVNLLGSVQIAIVMVSGDMRIRRFTPVAEKILNLMPSDMGRPIGHIKPNIDCPELEQLIEEVIETMNTLERDVRDRQGRWLSLRIRPYKDLENRIDGAVLTLFDVDAAKKSEGIEMEARGFAEAILEAVQQPVIVLTRDLRVFSVNRAFREQFQSIADTELGRPIGEFMGGRWNAPELRQLAADSRDGQGAPLEFELASVGSSGRPARVHARRFGGDGVATGIMLTIQTDAE